MAINVRGLCKFNISLASNALFKSNFVKPAVRFLYTEQDLGITAYENARFIFHNQFVTIEDTFRSKMAEICNKDGTIYTEDLKAMLHLAQKNDDDMQLLNKMIEKYIANKSGDKLGSYVFGPVIMRMYYFLNQPRLAYAAFENPVLTADLQYHSTFRVLMCLLYKHNMFKEMREVYDKFVAAKGVEFIGRSSVLVYAACLKENTEEALDFALNRWRDEFNISKPTLRSCSMIALLAIKHNALETALEILAVVDTEFAISVRCLKLLIYANMERYLQIVPILRYAVEQADSGIRTQKFFANVIYEIEDKIRGLDGSELEAVTALINDVKRLELIESASTLDEFLLKPISIPVQVRMTDGTMRYGRPSRFNRPQVPLRQSYAEGLKRYI